MKTILTIILLITASVCFSQNTANLEDQKDYSLEDKLGLYFKDNNNVLNKFLGTWRYQNTTNNPTKIFEITFYKIEKENVGDMFQIDGITSKFKYIENGITIYNTYSNDNHNYITGSSIFKGELDKISLFYYEPNINNLLTRHIPYGDLYLTHQVSSRSVHSLHWIVQYFEGESTEVPFKIPVEMTLIKVN